MRVLLPTPPLIQKKNKLHSGKLIGHLASLIYHRILKLWFRNCEWDWDFQKKDQQNNFSSFIKKYCTSKDMTEC